MKKLPTALTVPSSTLKVWPRIAPPLEAIVLALAGRCGVEGGCADASVPCDCCEVKEARSKKLVSTPYPSSSVLRLDNCDLMVLLNTVACWAMVVPPRT